MGVGSNPCNTYVTASASDGAGTPRRIFRFGAFELRSETGELSKHGTRVKLQIKPLRVLEALLERPGELVTREELCKKLWAAGTFVDFESGLNTATNRLRTALGDSAESPRYVETLQRLGYRFVCPVIEMEDSRSASKVFIPSPRPAVLENNLPPAAEEKPALLSEQILPVSHLQNTTLRSHSLRRLTQVLTIMLAVLAFLFSLGYLYVHSNAAGARPVLQQLTF